MRPRHLVGLVALLAQPALAQNLIVNGSFEQIAIAPNGGWTTFGLGWDAVAGWHAVGQLDAMGTFLTPFDGLITIDLNGASPARIEQAVPTVPGHRYTISFALSANMQGPASTKQMRVVAPGVSQSFVFDPVAEGATLSNPKWRNTTLQFVASSDSSLIAFEGVNPGAYGAAIDDVSVLDAGLAGCNTADVAAPYTVLNFFDVSLYLSMYNQQSPAADLAAPFGVLNFFDVSAFLSAFNAGCP